MSWERGGNTERRELPDIFPGGGDVKGSSGGSNKRSRTGSDDGRPVPSPIGSGSNSRRKDKIKMESNVNDGG